MSIQPTLPRSAAALAPVFLSALDEDLAFKFFVVEHWTPQEDHGASYKPFCV